MPVQKTMFRIYIGITLKLTPLCLFLLAYLKQKMLLIKWHETAG